MASKLTITPLTTTIGARVEGVDMRKKIPPEHAEQVYKALDDHMVLHFPDQHIGLAEQTRFASLFGQPEPLATRRFLGSNQIHVTIEADTIKEGMRQMDWRAVELPGWHTDEAFAAQVPRAAVLRAEVISPVGGGTSWSSMCAAYDALSPMMQDWLCGLQTVHVYPVHYKPGIKFETFPVELQEKFDEEFPPRHHPLVFEHPRSGRRGLFLNPGTTCSIVGMSEKESRMLLRFLFNHAVMSDFVYRHRWSEGDIMLWDELATLHLAPQDYHPHPRRMVRITAGRVTPTAPSAAAQDLVRQAS